MAPNVSLQVWEKVFMSGIQVDVQEATMAMENKFNEAHDRFQRPSHHHSTKPDVFMRLVTLSPPCRVMTGMVAVGISTPRLENIRGPQMRTVVEKLRAAMDRAKAVVRLSSFPLPAPRHTSGRLPGAPPSRYSAQNPDL